MTLHMLESAQKAFAFLLGKSRTEYERDEVLRFALLHLIKLWAFAIALFITTLT